MMIFHRTGRVHASRLYRNVRRAAGSAFEVMTGGRRNSLYRRRWGRPSSPWRRPSLRRSNRSPNSSALKALKSYELRAIYSRTAAPWRCVRLYHLWKERTRRQGLRRYILLGGSARDYLVNPSMAPPLPQKRRPRRRRRTTWICAAGRRPYRPNGKIQAETMIGAPRRAMGDWRARRRAGRPPSSTWRRRAPQKRWCLINQVILD